MRLFKKSVALGFLLAFVALPLIVWWQFTAITDWWRLRDYVAPAPVVALANTTQMTDDARHIFYVNHPKLHTAAEDFRRDCPQSEQTIVLGCYHAPQQGIAIYDVTDPRLTGVEEVTAAHEMLHAAYDRLDRKQKQRIDRLLSDFYAQLNDTRIQQTIDQYRKTEPGQEINEMHSIFGTEVAELPRELEQHYSQYFKDRSVVVKLANGYEGEFSRRLSEIREAEGRLTDLKADIDGQEQALKAQLADLEAERRRLDELRSSGRFEDYNAAVPVFNSKVNAYNQAVNRFRRDVNSYNSLLEQYNLLAGELRSLYSAIDTRTVPQVAQ